MRIITAFLIMASGLALADPSVSFIENRGTGSPASGLPGWTPSVLVWVSDPAEKFTVVLTYVDAAGLVQSAQIECGGPICLFEGVDGTNLQAVIQ